MFEELIPTKVILFKIIMIRNCLKWVDITDMAQALTLVLIT